MLGAGSHGQRPFCESLFDDAGSLWVPGASLFGAGCARGQEEECRGECEGVVGAGFDAGALEGAAAISGGIAVIPPGCAEALWAAGLHGEAAQWRGVVGVQERRPQAAMGISGVFREREWQAEQQQGRQDL